MNGTGVRPNKLWHWFAVAFLVATFLAEPRATMALTWELFRGAGAVGGELLTGDPDPDVLNLETEGDDDTDVELEHEQAPAAGDEDAPLEHEEVPSAGAGDVPLEQETGATGSGFRVDATSIRGVLDRGADGVLRLHASVEDLQDQIRADDGLVITVGGEGR